MSTQKFNIYLRRQSQPQKAGFFVAKNMKSNNKSLLHLTNSIQFEETLLGQKFLFSTKPGLFSKDRVDSGTKLLIENMVIRNTDTVLDLGCGYGVLGLTAAKIASLGKVYLVDNDQRAINFAKINSLLNKIENTEIIISDGFQNVPSVLFDVILSNPPSHISNLLLNEFIQGSFEYLKPDGGKLFLVVEKRITNLIKRLLNKYFNRSLILTTSQNYTVFLSIK